MGTTLSVIAAVVSEYFGGSRASLGVYISQQAALFHFAEAWAAILVASFSGIVFYLVIVAGRAHGHAVALVDPERGGTAAEPP